MREDGIRLFGPRYLRMKGRTLAAMFNTSWSESPVPRRGPHDQLRFLAKGRRHMVLSEENFVGNVTDAKGRVALPLYPLAAPRLSELVEKWSPVPVNLFIAVRDPTSYLASAYSQAMFGGTHMRPRQFRLRNDWKAVDWADYVGRIRAVAGIGQVYLWRQEDYNAVLPQILQHLLHWDDTSMMQMIEGRVHQGLSVSAVQQTIEFASEGQTGKLAREARRLFPVGEHHAQFELFSASAQRKSAEMYAVQMAKIAEISGVTVLRPPSDAQEG